MFGRGKIWPPSSQRHRFFLPFGLLASTSATAACKGPDGVELTTTTGYPMPRAGWIVGVYVAVDITAVSGGTMTVKVYTDGSLVLTGPSFTSAGTKQEGYTTASPPVRFVAQQTLGIQTVLDAASITWDDVRGNVEIELER